MQAKVVAEANKAKAESEGKSTRRNQQRAGTFSHPGGDREDKAPRHFKKEKSVRNWQGGKRGPPVIGSKSVPETIKPRL